MDGEIGGDEEDEGGDDPAVVLVDGLGGAVNHFLVGHGTGGFAAEPSGEGEDDVPEGCAEGGKECEAFEVHAGEAGGDGDELTDAGEEAADEGGEFAVIAEDFFGSGEGFFGEEEVFSVFVKQGSAEFCAEIVIDIGAGEAAEGTGEEGDGQVKGRNAECEAAAGGEESGGDHHNFTGEGDEGTFDSHKKEDQEKSPDGGVCGDGFQVSCDEVKHRSIRD